MVRPPLATVHCAASGQLAQAARSRPLAPPVPAGLIVVVTPAGQRTVPALPVDGELVLGQPSGRRDRRLHLAHRLDAGRVERLQQLTGAVGRVAVDHERPTAAARAVAAASAVIAVDSAGSAGSAGAGRTG